MSLGVQSLQRGQIGKGALQTVLPDISGRFQGSSPRRLGVFFFLLVPEVTCNSMLPSDHRPFASDLELENLGMK